MQHRTRVVLAGAIGNLLEWYDFGLYGLLAPVLASLFFPGHNRIASLLAIYGGFAGGFAMRPIGAIVLGHLGDRVGRRFVLTLSVLLMGIATVAVGILPTYAVVGIWAPILLILIRLFQGFSVGGEFVDSVTYLVEVVPPGRRGIAGSVANIGSTAGMLLAAGIAAAVTTWAGSARLNAWAWRLPFLIGGIIASAAYLLRRHLPETAHQAQKKDQVQKQAQAQKIEQRESPLLLAIREQPGVMLACVLFTSGYGIANYLIMVFLPTYAHEFGHVTVRQALLINTVGQAVAFFAVPLSGWISDRVLSRRTILALAFIAQAAFSWEAFRLAQHAGLAGLWASQLTLALLLAIVMGTAPAMLAEQFRAGYRVSAHAVTFNIGIGIAGGTAPMVAVALIQAFSNTMVPAAYLIAAAVLSAISVLALHENTRAALD